MTPARHVKNKGWNHLEPYWAGPSKTGWDSPEAQAFAIGALPTSLLIGPDGRIVWQDSGSIRVGGKALAEKIKHAIKP